MNEKYKVVSDPEIDINSMLFRYMDLPKFVDLLSTSQLYFAPTVHFSDCLEGTLPEDIRKSLQECYSDTEEHKGKDILDIEYENKVKTNISCWTARKNESMALWNLYGKSQQSLAIAVPYKKLINAAFYWPDVGTITFKKVKYFDLNAKVPDGVYGIGVDTFGFKHHAYEFEEELRIIIYRGKQRHPEGVKVPVDLKQILNEVRVAPYAEEWFFDIVKDLAEKYNLDVPVVKSELSVLIDKVKK